MSSSNLYMNTSKTVFIGAYEVERQASGILLSCLGAWGASWASQQGEGGQKQILSAF